MKSHRFPEKYKNCIIAVLTIIVNLVLLSICFDFYYDLYLNMIFDYFLDKNGKIRGNKNKGGSSGAPEPDSSFISNI